MRKIAQSCGPTIKPKILRINWGSGKTSFKWTQEMGHIDWLVYCCKASPAPHQPLVPKSSLFECDTTSAYLALLPTRHLEVGDAVLTNLVPNR